MSAYLETLYSALRTVISSQWTDVPTGGIWETEQVEMVPWERLVPPYAVVVIPSMPLADWGLNSMLYNPQIDLYYVAAVTGGSSNLRAKLEGMRDYILSNDISTGQVLNVHSIGWGNDIPANVIFISKNYTHRAGRMTLDALIGETVTF